MSFKETMRRVFTRKYIITLVILVSVILVINLWLAGVYIISGSSMQPTMDSGNVVFVNKLAEAYRRFDIVIIKTPDSRIVKRVIGLPRDTVQIKDGYVYINGKQLDDVVSEKTEFAGTAFQPLTLGEGEYFVLGDNREESKDSRYKDIGVIKQEQIVGRVVFRLSRRKS